VKTQERRKKNISMNKKTYSPKKSGRSNKIPIRNEKATTRREVTSGFSIEAGCFY
jgi:hypothetical protein